MLTDRKKKLLVQDITAAALIAGAVFLLIFRAKFFGIVADEEFYLTIPLRLASGQGLFTDEWHLSQLSGVLLYLPVKLYLLINGSIDGIVLFFRYIFCSFQVIYGSVLYITFRKKGASSVFIAALCMLMLPLGFVCMSYNTMGTAFFFVTSCLLYMQTDKCSVPKIILAGVFYACTVLCNPFAVLLFPVHAGFCLYFNKASCKANPLYMQSTQDKQKTKKTPDLNIMPYRYFSRRFFIMFSCGILIVFIYFLIILFMNSSPADIIKNLPNLLNDPEHGAMSEEGGIPIFSFSQLYSSLSRPAGAPMLAVLFIPLIIAFADKKRLEHRQILCPVIFITSAIYIIFFHAVMISGKAEYADDINFYYFPLTFTGLGCYLLTKDKDKYTFAFFWCAGVIYSFFMMFSSNLGMFTMICGYIISACGALRLAENLLHELKDEKAQLCADGNMQDAKASLPPTHKFKLKNILLNANCILLALTVFGSAGFHLCSEYVSSFIQRYSSNQSFAYTRDGVFSGVSMAADQWEKFSKLSADIDTINAQADNGDMLYVTSNIPACYLESDLGIGIYTCWLNEGTLLSGQCKERLKNYYALHPENIPDYIYIPFYDSTLKRMNGYEIESYLYAVKELFDGECIKAKVGYIFTVSNYKG